MEGINTVDLMPGTEDPGEWAMIAAVSFLGLDANNLQELKSLLQH